MSQPSFVPVSQSAEVRPSYPTPTPEIGRAKKPGLLGAPNVRRGLNQGTPAPGEGYAYTLARRLGDEMTFENPHDRADVECAIALLAAERASVIGRGPTLEDAQLARARLGLNTELVTHDQAAEFAGLAHSYVAQRRFVDVMTTDGH